MSWAWTFTIPLPDDPAGHGASVGLALFTIQHRRGSWSLWRCQQAGTSKGRNESGGRALTRPKPGPKARAMRAGRVTSPPEASTAARAGGKAGRPKDQAAAEAELCRPGIDGSAQIAPRRDEQTACGGFGLQDETGCFRQRGWQASDEIGPGMEGLGGDPLGTVALRRGRSRGRSSS